MASSVTPERESPAAGAAGPLPRRRSGWWRRVVEGLFGPAAACLWCGRPASDVWLPGGLCWSCWRQVAWVGGPGCGRCGKPLRSPGTCSDCARRPVPFTLSRAPAVYDGLWRDLIHALKFQGRRELAQALALPMAALARQQGYVERCHALVPVPLSAPRLQRRGYNQAELLARAVACQTGIPVLPVLYRSGRRTEGTPQSLKGAHERRRSLRGAFTALDPTAVRDLVLVVVDDVYTTGATLDEAARALLRAGAREVWGLVAAVGLSDPDLAAGPLPAGAGGGDGPP